MIDLNRRRFIAATGAALLAPAVARANETIKVFSADVRPLSIAQGPRRGLILDIAADALGRAGYSPHYEFSAFGEAMEKTQATPEALMSPVARNEARDPLFSWIAKIIDVPQAIGSLRASPKLGLDEARQVGGIGVVAGGVQESYLSGQGFSNLRSYKTAQEIAAALLNGEIDGWYGTATEISVVLADMGQPEAVHVGPALQSVPVWLAGNLDMGTVDVARIASALEEMTATGDIERHYRSYVTA